MTPPAGPIAAVEAFARSEPSDELCARIAELSPANPFRTKAYLRANVDLGWWPWAFCLREDATVTAGCFAFSRRGRLAGTLEIPSFQALPNSSAGEVFLREVLRVCRRERLSALKLNSFASEPFALPSLPGRVRRTPRREWVLDLLASDLASRLDAKHVQSIKRARKCGLIVREGSDPRTWEEHARMCAASMSIRSARGESVSSGLEKNRAEIFVRNGAGTIFQAIRDSEVLSSMLVLLAARGAYEQTSGTSTEGRSVGASHFLLHEVSLRLRERGLQVFNLGGAGPENPGLARFKARFGATPVDLEAAEAFVAGSVGRLAEYVRRLVRRVAG